MKQANPKKTPGFQFLFSPISIGGLRIKNRIVALPVHTGFAYPDGHVSPWLTKFYARLADSGAGMVVVANASVSRDGVVSRFNLRADKDDFIPGLTQLAEAIKDNGAIACLQLNHAGRFARIDTPLLPSPVSGANLAFNMESLKDFMDFFPFEKRFGLTRHFIRQLKTWSKGMTDNDRERVIAEFASAASRAFRAGFDMVELHGANGYLLCQYLSSFTNRLTVKYGPDFESRTTFPLRVLQAVKQILPSDFPIGFRLLLKEWVPDGIDLPEAIRFATLLADQKVAYLSVSAGSYNSIFSQETLQKMAETAYLKTDTAKLKKAVSIPVIAAGRITTPEQANKLIRNGTTDLVGLGRPLRTDPGWVKKAASGSEEIITCINCNWCLKRVVLEQGFNCSRWPKIVRDRSRLEHKLLTRNFHSLWVITSEKDIEAFKGCWSLVDPGRETSHSPRVLFLDETGQDKSFQAAQKVFLQWLKIKMDPLGFRGIPESYQIRESENLWERLLLDEIVNGGLGQIFIGADRTQPWRARLLYKKRRRVMVMLSPNPNLQRILVPIDFSETTLLIIKFVQKTLMRTNEFNFTFIHVVSDSPSKNLERQWKKFKRIARVDQSLPLHTVKSSSNIASTISNIIKAQHFGTIVMGKRGLSGIKRWLLGSVSARVIHQLTDQTLFLID